jgi:ribosomal protein S18 acetylase RimI-like enzyme
MTPAFTIRRAVAADRDGLCRHVRALAAHHGYDPASVTLRNVAEHFLAPGLPMVVLVAELADATLAGYAAASPTHESGYASPGFYLSDLHVEAANRKMGIGRALIAAMAAETRRAGREHLWWQVDRSNEAAERWYRAVASFTAPMTVFALFSERFEELAAEGERRLGGEDRAR